MRRIPAHRMHTQAGCTSINELRRFTNRRELEQIMEFRQFFRVWAFSELMHFTARSEFRQTMGARRLLAACLSSLIEARQLQVLQLRASRARHRSVPATRLAWKTLPESATEVPRGLCTARIHHARAGMELWWYGAWLVGVTHVFHQTQRRSDPPRVSVAAYPVCS